MSRVLAQLATKFRPPSHGARHLRRPRLVEGLSSGPISRVVLLSAPAGSGKTTLLAEWYEAVRARGLHAAWLSLDDHDRGAERFLPLLLGAMDVAGVPGASDALSRLEASPDALVDEVLGALLHDLDRSGAEVVVFLDDYHEVRDTASHAIVERLVRYATAVHLVIGTRREPPLAFERLRVRGDVLEVRWNDLRFTSEEGRRYLQDVCQLPLSEDQVRALCHRSEGWITALQLSAMSVSGASDADRFVTSLSEVDRNIAHYLLEDVLRRQPPAVRQFLLRTSCLERMTAPLCDAVTGRDDGQQQLESLVRKNLFTFCLDDRHGWFRYHHLFSEFLRERASLDASHEAADLHDRASEWCERNGLLSDAVRYAIAGRRFRRAARVLEVAGRAEFRAGNFKELRRCIDSLLEETVRRSPALCVLHGWALTYLGQFSSARERIACAEAALHRAPAPAAPRRHPAIPLDAELLVLRAVLGIVENDEPGTTPIPGDIVELFPPEERALRSFAAIALAYAERSRGPLAVALSRFQEALAASEACNASLMNLIARMNVGIVMHLMGRSREAEESLRGSLQVATDRLWLSAIGSAFVRFGLALVLNDSNQPREALHHLSDAIATLEASDAFGFIGLALVERARAHAALRHTAACSEDLARARGVASSHAVRRVGFRADLLGARLAVIGGDLTRAAGLLEVATSALGGVPPDGTLTERQEALVIERVRFLIADARPGDAVRLAGRAIHDATRLGRRRDAVELLALQATAWCRVGDLAKAAAKLTQALDLAGDRLVRPFLDAGAGLLPVLQMTRAAPATREASERLLASVDEASGQPSPVASAARQEGLHCREAQILELVASGLRNREIGERLFLSEETVKWYLKRLYDKLSVRTRTEAIAAARRRGLMA